MVRYLTALFLVVVFSSCGGNREVSWSFPDQTGFEARGRELFYGLAACTACHTAPDWSSQFNDWSVSQLRFAIRNGTGADGSETDQHEGFQWLSETDTLSLIAFLGAQSGGLLQSEDLYEESKAEEEIGYVPSINPRYRTAYGKYLVDNVARCGSCHTMGEGLFTDEVYLGGGEEVEVNGRDYTAPALLGDGNFVSWSPSQMQQYLTYGTRPDGTVVDTAACPIGSYRQAKQEDLEAMVAYLGTVKPSE